MSSKQIFILRLSQSIQISPQIFRLALCSSLFIRDKLAATVHSMSATFVLNMVYVILLRNGKASNYAGIFAYLGIKTNKNSNIIRLINNAAFEDKPRDKCVLVLAICGIFVCV